MCDLFKIHTNYIIIKMNVNKVMVFDIVINGV